MEREVLTNRLFKRVHDKSVEEMHHQIKTVDYQVNSNLIKLKERVNTVLLKDNHQIKS